MARFRRIVWPAAAPWLPAFLLLYLGAGLAVSLTLFPVGDVDVESDFFAELGPAAQALARGELDVANHPYKGPGQPVLLLLLHGLLQLAGADWYRSAVVLSLLAAGATLAAAWRLGLALGGRAVAAGAVLLLAGSPVFAVQAHKASSDLVFLALSTWSLALVLEPVVPGSPPPARRGRWFAAGLLAGAALLTRYAGVALPVWLVAAARLQSGGRRLDDWRSAGWALAGVALPVAPWLALNLVQAGTLVATANAENLARELGAQPGLAGAAGHYLANLGVRLVESLVALHGRAGALVAGGALAVALVGVAGRRRRWRQAALLLWVPLVVMVLAAVFFRPRFSLPLAPVTAAMGAWLLLRRLPRPRRLPGGLTRGPAWLAVAALALLAVPETVSTVRFHAALQPRDLAGVIAHLRAEAAAGQTGGRAPVVMSRKAHAPFHAGVGWRPYPGRPLDATALLRDARARGATHVLAGSLERQYAEVACDLGRLGELAGVRVAYADSAQTLYALDPAVSDDALGAHPRLPALRDALAAARAAGEAAGALTAARELAGTLAAVGRREEARQLLQEAVATGALGVPPDHPELLRVRVNLAWFALLTDRPAVAIDAVGPVLDVFAAQDDHALAARACESLGIGLAQRGRAAEAREVLHAAAVFWEAAGRDEDAARARRLRAAVGGS